MFKVFENYIEERHAKVYEHDKRAVDVNFPIPSVFSCWHIYDTSSHHFLMVYFRLHCGQMGRGNLRKAFEKASNAIGRRDIDFCFLGLDAFGINKKVPCLITALEIKDDAQVFARNTDQTILDMARIAFGMSPNFKPASGRRYDQSGLMLLGMQLGFDAVYDASNPEVLFRRKEVQSQGTKLDDLKGLRERVESKIKESMKRIESLENDTHTTTAADWNIKADLAFTDISGMDNLKNVVSRQVIWPLLNPDKMRKYKLKMPCGMILHGEPGTGKTFFAKALAGEIGCSIREITSADFGSKYLHESANLIHQLFREAKEHAPAILLFDEIDVYLGIRGSAEMEKRVDEVAAFLAELQECGDNRVFVVGTTNFVQNIDPAITRSGRLDLMFEVKAPDEVQREQLFTDSLKRRPKSRKLDLGRLVQLSDGLVAADIVHSVNDAALVAALQDRNITQHDLEDAVRRRSIKGTKLRKKIGFKTIA